MRDGMSDHKSEKKSEKSDKKAKHHKKSKKDVADVDATEKAEIAEPLTMTDKAKNMVMTYCGKAKDFTMKMKNRNAPENNDETDK